MAHVHIFLSTVSAEFRSYRDALRQHLDRPNVTVKVQEDFIATGTATLDKLDAYIQQCHAVIHLVGDMTGALAQPASVAVIRERYPDFAQGVPALVPFLEPNAPALSYTQWEAWLALYHRRVLIIAVPEDGAPRDKHYQLDEVQRADQQAHLARLASVERYPEIRFANADRLALGMLRSKLQDILAGLLATAQPAALHSIREPVADFVERQELATLRAAFGEGSVIIAGIQGAGGTGKTQIARRFAREIEARYPDVQIEIDLQGMSAQPLLPQRAMERIIRAFHPEARLPEDVADLPGLYVTVLKGKRAVLLLDNARDNAQVEPLLPPPGCAVIVTSCQHFLLPNMQVTELGKLAVDDARTLALKIADKRSGFAENVDAFLEACGYLALAIRVAVTTVVEKPTLSVEEHLRRLKENCLKNLTPVAAALQASYELLTAEQQRTLRLLAIFPSDFRKQAAAAICHNEDNGVSAEADPAELLSELHSSSLLEFAEVTGRFRLHDLTREFALGKLRECDAFAAQPEEPLARRRHADLYLQGLDCASQLYQQGGKHIRPALDWFDLARANVEAGFSWAVEHSASDASAARLVLGYALSGAGILLQRQNRREQIGWFEEALKAARRIGDVRGEHLSLAYLGNAHVALGQVSKGIEFLQQSLEFARKHRERHDEATSLGNLGVAYLASRELPKALGYNRRHLALACEIGDQAGQSKALSNMGCAHDARSEPRRAVKYFEKSLFMDIQMGDRAGEGKALGNLGVAYEKLGDMEIAVDYYRRHLAIATEIGDQEIKGQALFNLALLLMKLGQREEALFRAEAALKIYYDIESPRAEDVRQKLAEWRGAS